LKKKSGFTANELIATVRELNRSFRIVPFSIETYIQAIKIGKDYSLSFWDSMIVAAAYLSDCSILFSEDMQTNLLIYDKLRIVNPFQ
jgi:predicted nucleic acid-binding protein